MVKNPPAIQVTQETWIGLLGQEDPPEGGNGNLLQYSCLEKFHGQRSQASYTPLSHKESDTRD